MKERKYSILYKIIASLTILVSFIACAVIYAPGSDNWAITKFLISKSQFFYSGNGRFYYTSGVAVDSSGNIYVSDVGNHAIRKITPKGVVSTFAGNMGFGGHLDGQGTNAEFQAPGGLAVSIFGNVYVADVGNHLIRKISPSGFVSTLAGDAGERGSNDGVGDSARFSYPTSVAVDSSENVYVADSGNNTIRKISIEGKVTTIAGVALAAGRADESFGRYNVPKGIAVDSYGNVYVADSNNHSIRKITQKGELSTFAGHSTEKGIVDAVGDDARFRSPSSVAVDSLGQLFVADTSNHTIRKVSPQREVTTIAGQPGVSGMTDAVGKYAKFNYPLGIAVDSSGNIYVADSSNSTVRKINVSTGAVITIAGVAGKRGRSNSR